MFIPHTGALVGGRYDLRRVIGRGGMGEVWEASDRELEGPCAVKFMLQGLENTGEARSRFAHEAKIIARLRSPRTVQILGFGEHEQVPFLAMELLEGETLQSRLSRLGKLDFRTTFEVVAQIAQALEKAHEAGVIHRDLKPENIWLCAERELFVKVLDFGVAKSLLAKRSLETGSGVLLGTPQYMSPEQVNGASDIDHRADLWALGVLTIECLTGKSPFGGAAVGEVLMKILKGPPLELGRVPDLPPGLRSWWERALAADPRQRFQSAAELVEDLRPELAPLSQPASARASSPIQTPTVADPIEPVSHSQHAQRRVRRRGSVVLAVLVALLGVLVGAWNWLSPGAAGDVGRLRSLSMPSTAPTNAAPVLRAASVAPASAAATSADVSGRLAIPAGTAAPGQLPARGPPAAKQTVSKLKRRSRQPTSPPDSRTPSPNYGF